MVLEIRKTKKRDGSTVYQTIYPLTGVERVLAGIRGKGTGLVHGINAGEEFARNYLAASSQRLRVGGEPLTFWRFLAKFPVKRQNRVESFLRSSARMSDYGLNYGEGLFEELRALTFEDLSAAITRRYFETRKVQDGAADEIATLIASLANFRISGDCVFYFYSWAPEHRDILALWLWAHSPDAGRLVIISNNDPFETDTSPFDVKVERTYVPPDELVALAAIEFGISHSSATRAFEVFLTNLDRRPRRDQTISGLTLSEADDYLQLLPLFKDSQENAVAVPRQAPAPLRFDSSSGKIDVLVTREHGPRSAKIRGASRAVLSHAKDLLAYPGIDNSIPAFPRRLERIIQILEVLECGVEYDDAIIVELGAEITGLDSRVKSAEQSLGEHAVAEITAFFSVSFALLAQFELWAEYKSTAASTADVDERQAFFFARKLLASLSDEPIATGEARDRISAYLAHVIESDKGLQSKGATMSAENALASAAGAVLGREVTALGTETKDKIRDEASTRIKDFFFRNAEHATKFALARGAHWLIDALRHIGIGG